MIKRFFKTFYIKGIIFSFISVLVFSFISVAQEMKFVPKTLLPENVIIDIVNEISGKLPYNYIVELGGYERDRKEKEYLGLYFESEFTTDRAKEYGFSDVHIEHYNEGGREWDAEVGELWLIEPEKKLLISYRDMPQCLWRGSLSSDLITELVDVGYGEKSSDYEGKDIKGKIIFASGSVNLIFPLAEKFGAVGAVVYGQPRALDYPDQMVLAWTNLGSQKNAALKFAFNISPRTADEFKKLFKNNEKVKIRVNVKTTYYNADSEVPTALIPGDGSSKQEVVLCAHLFEGIAKQGALDNFSGCAVILEAGRALIKLINEGKIDRPKRSIRFLWTPEKTGTRMYLQRYPDEVKNMVAAINLDMVGEDVAKNHNSLVLYRTIDSRTSFLNDVCQEFFEYVGISNRQRIHEFVGNWKKKVIPINDPNGTKDPFYYDIESYASGSDHEVFIEREFGVPAVMFNNWPDMFYHSNQDTPDKSDPTQLKRAVFLTLASAYIIANADIKDIPMLLSLVDVNGSIRIRQDLEAGLKELELCTSDNLKQTYKDVKDKLRGSYIREKIGIKSVGVLAEKNKDADKLIKTALKKLDNCEIQNGNQLKEFYELKCKKFGLPLDEPKLSLDEERALKITPVSTEKGRKEVIRAGNSSGLHSYTVMELTNFIDSGLSVQDIKNSICLQFGKLDVKDVFSFYNNLKEKGFIDLVVLK